MYLDFVSDIIKVNDNVIVTCDNDEIEGVVIKISKELIAVQIANGSIVIKHDDVITNIKVTNKINLVKEKGLGSNCDNQEGQARCGMILVKKDKSESFHCSICGKDKVSKKYAIEVGNPNIRICNACYGWTLSRLENK